MAKDSFIDHKTEPKGKRTIRVNIYGNIVGYIGRTRWIEFGINTPTNMREAEAWENHDPNWKDA